MKRGYFTWAGNSKLIHPPSLELLHVRAKLIGHSCAGGGHASCVVVASLNIKLNANHVILVNMLQALLHMHYYAPPYQYQSE